MIRTSFPALGTTAEVVVTEPRRLAPAVAVLREELDAIDRACSRFREDSELSRLEHGRAVRVGPLLAEALAVALRAARLTDGLVDPTVATAVRALGYDRDYADVTDGGPAAAPEPAPGWHRVLLDGDTVVLPRGVELDLGATAKALAADRAALAIARHTGGGTLVNLGGDLAAAGPAPRGGWQVAIGDDHTDAADTIVTLTSGGLATSGITRRRWRRGGRTVHHIVDPRTGDIPDSHWRTVSVAAKSCVDANTASTAAIVLAAKGQDWLTARGLPARLVTVDGEAVTTPGWPGEPLRRAS